MLLPSPAKGFVSDNKTERCATLQLNFIRQKGYQLKNKSGRVKIWKRNYVLSYVCLASISCFCGFSKDSCRVWTKNTKGLKTFSVFSRLSRQPQRLHRSRIAFIIIRFGWASPFAQPLLFYIYTYCLTY